MEAKILKLKVGRATVPLEALKSIPFLFQLLGPAVAFLGLWLHPSPL